MSNNLPVTRIKTIMKSSADVETISKESLQLVTIATELFIKHLAQKAEIASNKKEILYKDIAEVVNTSERYDFLTEIIPRKITVMQFKEICAKKAAEEETSEESNSDSAESNSSLSSDSENSEDGSEHNSSSRSSPGSK